MILDELGVATQQEKKEKNARMGAFQWANSKGHKASKNVEIQSAHGTEIPVVFESERGRPWQIKAVGPNLVWSKGQLGSGVGSLGLCLPAARLWLTGCSLCAGGVSGVCQC